VKDTPKASQQAWFRGILADDRGPVDDDDDTKLECVAIKRKF